MKQAKQIIQLWIRDVEDNGRSLTKWEDDFIGSLCARNRCLQARGGIARRPHRSPVSL